MAASTPFALNLDPERGNTQSSGSPEGRLNGQREFLFGVSAYPEIQTRQQWRRTLNEFRRAHMNVVRVAESAWGNLETSPGQYNFGWLHDFLDDLDARGMKAIVGTATYIPPQWLTAAHPETLIQLQPRMEVDPMARKAACLNHPLYREACRRYIRALVAEFKDHPAVIGWQLDNEIGVMVNRICYNPACEKAWQGWLKRIYKTPEEFNERLQLVSWGMRVQSFEEVPQPTQTVEQELVYVPYPSSSNSRHRLPALSLAHFHFRRDVVLDFLIEQAHILRAAGARQWITSDGVVAVTDDPLASKALDVGGLNFYQPTADDPEFWDELAWHQDMSRSANGKGHFITTETRFGTRAWTYIVDAAPSREQLHMWGLQAAAIGASGLLYWSGNRWRGGHWPYAAAPLDWSGQPEPDFNWAVEMGSTFRQLGPRLLANPVKARAVVLTDFDQRSTLLVYPCERESDSILPKTFDAFHRLGIGTDCMNLKDAEEPERLAKYELVMIPAAVALDGSAVPRALSQYAQSGGVVLITPFTAYQTWDGTLRGDGFGANLAELTGTTVQTIRQMKESPKVEWTDAGMSIPSVASWGFCEFLNLRPEARIIGRFKSEEAILNGRPAATERKLGNGKVIKLAFWPDDDSMVRLLHILAADDLGILGAPAPQGIQAIPRTDQSLFVVNTTSKSHKLNLARTVRDRLSGVSLSGPITIKPYQVLWLEAGNNRLGT